MNTALLRKWDHWLDRIFDEQLKDLIINQHIFHQFSDATAPYVSTGSGSNLAHWMKQGYVAYSATAIRRITEPPHPRWQSVSLVILLEEIKVNAALFSRQWQRERYRRAFRGKLRSIAHERADRDFCRVTGNQRATTLPLKRVERDINGLKRKSQPIKRLVDKVIAHTEADRRRIGTVQYKQIDDMIELLVDTYKRYCLLIKGSTCDPLVPLSGFSVKSDLEKLWP